MRRNRVQQKTVLDLYQGNPDGSPSYGYFRHRVSPLPFEPDVAMIHYVGMMVGIEPQGYADS